MHPEAAFLAGYAAALVGVAVGLVALGRRSTDPWSSKVLAGSRPPEPEQPDAAASWLETDVPAFHLGISAVALGAALALTAANVVLHHRPVEVVVHLVLLAAISVNAHRLRSTARASSARGGASPAPSAAAPDRHAGTIR